MPAAPTPLARASLGELLLPGLEAAGAVAALGGVCVGGEACEHGEGEEGGRRKSLALGHQKIPWLANGAS